MTAGRTSVVVPNLDGRDLLPACLEALRAQTTPPREVIVVDNGSADGSVALVRERFPEVRVVALGENRGFAGGMNAGIAEANGEAVAFLNNDAEPRPAWLEELAACLARHSRAAAVTSKLLLAASEATLDGAGDGLTRSFLPYVRGHGRRDEGQFEEEVEVFGASGTASLWRADVLRELGGFDERFFAYFEDVDLSFRARLLGWECWYAPRSIAVHRRGATSGDDPAFTVFHSARNRWFMLLKDAPGRLLLRRAPWLLAGEAFWWGRAVRRRAVRRLLAAYGELFRARRTLAAERRRIQGARRTTPGEIDRLLGRPR